MSNKPDRQRRGVVKYKVGQAHQLCKDSERGSHVYCTIKDIEKYPNGEEYYRLVSSRIFKDKTKPCDCMEHDGGIDFLIWLQEGGKI